MTRVRWQPNAVVQLAGCNWRGATFVPARDRGGISARSRIHDLRQTTIVVVLGVAIMGDP
jgi:hypothetical protein